LDPPREPGNSSVQVEDVCNAEIFPSPFNRADPIAGQQCPRKPSKRLVQPITHPESFDPSWGLLRFRWGPIAADDQALTSLRLDGVGAKALGSSMAVLKP